MELLDLPFSDLFVASTVESSWISGGGIEGGHGIPEELVPEAIRLRGFLREEQSKAPGQSFRVEWGTARRELLRVRPQVTAKESPLFMCRRLLPFPLPLHELGMPKQIINLLFEKLIPAGLILFCGEMGAGKTTMASSYVVEYVSRHGLVAMTAEVPPELNIEGSHGDKGGRIYQAQVESEEAKPALLRAFLRSSARLIFDGEIVSPESAEACQKLSATGQHVISTFHASDPITALIRFSAMAGNNNVELSRIIVAVFHLELRPRQLIGESSATAISPRIQKVTPLLFMGEGEKQMRSAVADGAWSALENDLDRQRRRLLHGGAL